MGEEKTETNGEGNALLLSLTLSDDVLTSGKLYLRQTSATKSFFMISQSHFVDTEVCFAISLSGQASEETFALIKKSINYIVHQYGCHSTNYCIMLRQDDHVPISSITFEFEDATETDIFNKVNKLTKPTAIRPLLCDDLRAVRDTFKSPRVRLESKKVSP